MRDEPFAIACAINQPYVLPLAVLIESLLHHLRPGFRPVLYLVHTGISEASVAAIASRVETHPIIPSAVQLAAAPRDPHFPAEASIPLLLHELLPPGIGRVLFLDADLLVMDDLATLWETPLDDYVLAAAVDGAVPLCSAIRGVKNWKALGIPPDAQYFNGGVLLIHLARWREREVNRRVRHYFETTREPVDFLHQEALNAVLWNDWKKLDSRWNLPASYAGRPHGRTPSDDLQRTGIVHFAGRMKPWRAPVGGPFNGRYQEVLERVLPLFPAEPPSVRDRLNSVYDRYFRSACYPFEHYLWRKRLL